MSYNCAWCFKENHLGVDCPDRELIQKADAILREAKMKLTCAKIRLKVSMGVQPPGKVAIFGMTGMDVQYKIDNSDGVRPQQALEDVRPAREELEKLLLIHLPDHKELHKNYL